MYVTKRNKKLEILSFDKILNRVKKIGQEANIQISISYLVMKVIDQLYDKIPTTKIDELTAEQCAALASQHPDFSILAARIIISNHQKNTLSSFIKVIKKLYHYKDIHGHSAPLISKDLWTVVNDHGNEIDAMIDYSRDNLIDYFGFKTLEKSYLFKIGDEIIERPQHMWMRVAIGIHGNDLHSVKETYDLMSQKYFTHATPTLYNAGTPRAQLSSCYLIGMEEDSIRGIYNTLGDCAQISKYSGGIGLHIHNIRAKDSHILGTNGKTDGIIPMLRVFNATARYVNQCFTPDTCVYSKSGPKQMKNITTDDNLITIDGSFKKVNEVIINKINKEILEITTTNTLFPVKVTKEHDLYLLKNQKKTINFSLIKDRLESGIIKPDFYNASELTEDDFVGFPIPTFERDNEIDELDYYKMYGIMLGNTYIYNSRNEFEITLKNDMKSDLKEFVKMYLTKKEINYWECENNGCSSIRWSDDKSLNLTIDFDSENQKVIKEDFLHLPKNKILCILEGLSIESNDVKEFSSNTLIMQLRYLFLRLGILTSDNLPLFQLFPLLKKVEQKGALLDLMVEDYFEWNGILWNRVKTINKINYEGEVYDFNMIDNHNYLTDMGLVHNSGKRNGSIAVYLEPWHADIEDFLEMKKNQGDEELKARDLFYALWIPDLFMERVKDNDKWSLFCPNQCLGLADVYGDQFKELYKKYEDEGKHRKVINARDLWFRILDSQMETGVPYLCFKDASNTKSNQKNLGTIKSSNLCVAPETLILTDKGHKEIKSLEGQKVNVWNGEEFSEVTICKTGENQELMEVEISDGCVLHCTPYHKFFIEDKYESSKINTIIAKDLKENDKIIKCEYPIIDNNLSMKYAYKHGSCCDEILYDILYGSSKCDEDIFIEENYYVPIDYSLKTKLEWFAGYCDADGIITRYENYEQLEISSDNKEFLFKVKLMLQTCGINPKITNKFLNKDNLIPKLLKEIYIIVISSINLQKLIKLGFSTRKLKISNHKTNRNEYEFVKIVKTENKGRIDDTYCFHEPKKNRGIFNGLLTSQCTEIMEYSDDKETAVCNLASIGLPNFVDEVTKTFNYEKLHEVTKVVTGNLNKIIDINFYPTEKTRRSNLLHRPIGIGVQGLADTFIMMNVAFQSDLAKEINKLIFETIYHGAVERSNEIAIERYNGMKEISDILIKEDFHKLDDDEYIPMTMKSKMIANLKQLEGDPIKKIDSQEEPDMDGSLSSKFDILKKNIQKYKPIKAELMKLEGDHLGAYSSFEKSPASEGILQFDMWNVAPDSNRYDWLKLKESIKKWGIRNSLLLAPMPTASTSQILGFNECFEPLTSNLYNRKTQAGEFVVTNKYLMRELIELNLWNEKVKNNIVANKGSIQQLTMLPEHIRNKYKIVWEMPMKHLIDMAADRGAYICQSQSMNLWIEDPTYNTLTSMHFYSWNKKLKTGIYYLRRKPKHFAQQFSIEPEKKENKSDPEEDEICELCSA
jgi:ribonucleoside-diphosphate reductase alpha chain